MFAVNTYAITFELEIPRDLAAEDLKLMENQHL